MSSVIKLTSCSTIMAASLLLSMTALTQGASASSPLTELAPCMNLAHPDPPHVRLKNKRLTVVVYLPDEDKGYYRGSRFDWTGIVGCAESNGHNFFGEWFDHYDPMTNDAVTGPAEEFRHPTSELGYDEAPPGGLFLKIGVGILRRIDAGPYSFGKNYPIVDHGRWTVKVHGRSVIFQQEIHSSIGYAYRYEKTLSIDRNGAVLSLKHHLKNLGTKPIDTEVYDHDFYMLDGKRTGPGMEIHLPFRPVPNKPLPSAAQIAETSIRFVDPLEVGHGVGAYLTGFSNKISDYDILFQDTQTGVGVEQTSDSAMTKAYLWATPTTVCPEAYIGIHLGLSQAQSWTIRYRFITPNLKR